MLILQGEHVFFPFLLAAFEGLKQYASYNKLQRASLQLLAQAGGDATLRSLEFWRCIFVCIQLQCLPGACRRASPGGGWANL